MLITAAIKAAGRQRVLRIPGFDQAANMKRPGVTKDRTKKYSIERKKGTEGC